MLANMHIGLHVKYPLFLSDFDGKLFYGRNVREDTQVPNFMKNRPVGAKLFHADRETNLVRLIAAF